MATKRRVLITGATGKLGLLLAERLAGDYELIQHGRTPKNKDQERRCARPTSRRSKRSTR